MPDSSDQRPFPHPVFAGQDVSRLQLIDLSGQFAAELGITVSEGTE